MYLNALESQRIPDTDTLSLIYLRNQGSLDSSIARHWGHRTKSIARSGNKIAFWEGEHSPKCDYICSHCVSKNSVYLENIDTTFSFSYIVITWLGEYVE